LPNYKHWSRTPIKSLRAAIGDRSETSYDDPTSIQECRFGQRATAVAARCDTTTAMNTDQFTKSYGLEPTCKPMRRSRTLPPRGVGGRQTTKEVYRLLMGMMRTSSN
jgi:hypothetical protein